MKWPSKKHCPYLWFPPPSVSLRGGFFQNIPTASRRNWMEFLKQLFFFAFSFFLTVNEASRPPFILHTSLSSSISLSVSLSLSYCPLIPLSIHIHSLSQIHGCGSTGWTTLKLLSVSVRIHVCLLLPDSDRKLWLPNRTDSPISTVYMPPLDSKFWWNFPSKRKLTELMLYFWGKTHKNKCHPLHK